MKMYFRSTSFFLLFLTIQSAQAQKWVDLFYEGANFFEIQKAGREELFNADGSKNPGWKQFSRWEYFMGQRVSPIGELPKAGVNYRAYKQFNNSSNTQLRQSNFPSWNSLGPNTPDGIPGLGRINFVRFHPSDTNTFYVGSPSGGLWRTIDGGGTFTVLNDTIATIGCADLIIHPTNDSILFLGTGDRTNAINAIPSDGVMVSTDQGYSWTKSALSFSQNSNIKIGRMAMNPLNPDLIFVAASNGIHRSTDGGFSWNNIQSGRFYDLEYHPTDTSILYGTTTTTFYKSTNGGASFFSVPVTSSTNRLELGVSIADPHQVYVLASNTASGLRGIYHSTDTGSSFAQVHPSTPNLLQWSADGSGSGGQGWYDLAIAVSPNDPNEIFVGGINSWKSTNGGTSFVLSSHWTGSNAFLVHADCHYLAYQPGTNAIFHTNDGGIYKSIDGGSTWTNLSSTLVITESYRIGISQHTYGEFLMGNQDNSTLKNTIQFGFKTSLGGDGMECIISHTDPFHVWASQPNGDLNRALDGGQTGGSYSSMTNGITESGAWVTPYIMDPYIEDVLYAGYNNIWKTTSKGNSWFRANSSGFPGFGGKVNALAVSNWWPDRILAAKGDDIYYSGDGGTNWSQISGGNFPQQNISYIAFDDTDLTGETIWVTFSGYTSNSKAFRTTNLGTNWTNESSGLPNVPANCVVVDRGSISPDVYVGTDIGVFIYNDSIGGFANYSHGLPNAVISELEIHYGEEKMIAGTHGRGMWEIDLLSKGISGLESFGKQGPLELFVWPNPSKGQINLAYKSLHGSGELQVLDLSGRKLVHRNLTFTGENQSLRLDLESLGLEKGLYLIQLSAGGRQVSNKVIIN